MTSHIALRGIGSISALGYGREAVWNSYEQGGPQMWGWHSAILKPGHGVPRPHGMPRPQREGPGERLTCEESGEDVAIYPIREEIFAGALDLVVPVYPRLAEMDRVVQLGCIAARAAAQDAEERGAFSLQSVRRVAVIVGSARGATATLESALASHLKGNGVPLLASPMTTMGVLSSTVAHLLKISGVAVDVSMTCTSGLHALLVGRALLVSGDVDAVVVGAAEAALTPFTLAQIAALRLSPPWDPSTGTPCRPLDGSPSQRARLVLGEAACIAILTRSDPTHRRGSEILGMGFSAEVPPSLTGIDPDGAAFRRAMSDALAGGQLSPQAVDAIAVHAPGTGKGDAAELVAIEATFGKLPPLLTTKFLTGHTYAVSGMLSIELAQMVLGGLRPALPPYATTAPLYTGEGPMHHILVNAAGFGGNAVSCLVGIGRKS